MRYLVAKDKKRRKIFSNNEMSYTIFKALRSSDFYRSSYTVNRRISSFFYALNPYSYKTRIRNRCVMSGRGSAVYRKFRISRLELREFFGKGFLYGFRRSSW